MTKRSKYEQAQRAAQTVRVKEIEAAWIGSLPAERAKAFVAAVEVAQNARRPGRPRTWRRAPVRTRPAPAASRRRPRKSGRAESRD